MKKIFFDFRENGRTSSTNELFTKELAQTVGKFKTQERRLENIKKTIYYSGILSCLLVLLAFTFTAVGCEKPKTTIDDTTETTIITNLAGTSWKLIEFVQTSEGTTKIPEPQSDQCYWIFFDSDSTLSGFATANELFGYYQMDTLTSTIKIHSLISTKAIELPDGDLYIECLKLVNSFMGTATCLKLYYNETDYLLFNSFNHENK